MSRQSAIWFSAMSLLVLGMGTTALMPLAKAAGEKDSKEVPAAKRVSDQGEAIDAARKVDLPLLKKAEKVIIEEVKRGGKGRRATLTKAGEIKELRQALKPSEVPPSGGITAATLTFYLGATILRKVWVYEGGEWGFERPCTSWTTGREADLWRGIQKHLR